MLKLVLKLLPWILLIALTVYIFIIQDQEYLIKGEKKSDASTILSKIEALGKLELINFRFQEVTKIIKENDNLDFKIFQIPIYNGAKALLVSQGNAVGCIDLTKITKEDIVNLSDTIYIKLPQPELCYFKVDLDQSEIYDLETKNLTEEDRKVFIEEMYQIAEQEIKNSALNSNILSQTQQQAKLILGPLLSSVSDKPIIFQYDPILTEIEID